MPCATDTPSYLTLNHEAAWQRGLAVNAEIFSNGIRLGSIPAYAIDNVITGINLNVADFALAQCNELYILDATRRSIFLYDAQQKRLEEIDRIATLFTNPVAIAHRNHTLYIADTAGPMRLLAFDTLTFQLRWTVSVAHDARARSLPLTNPFTPADLALNTNGEILALDSVNAVILRFHASGVLESTYGATELTGFQPTTLAAAPDGVTYVLDPTARRVWKFDPAGLIVNDNLIAFDAGVNPAALAVDANGVLYVGQSQPLAPGEEDTRFLLRYDADGQFLGHVEEFRGAATKLAIDSAGRIFVFNPERIELTVLRPEQRLSVAPGDVLPMGVYFSHSFDSATEGTRWHKAVLQSILLPDTQFAISFLTSDQLTFTLDGATRNLDTYLHSTPSIPAINALPWTTPAINPTDALISAPPGRYLWLRIQLTGREQRTPEVNTVTVHLPRMSYLRYLPAVYQDDPKSREFLERFLSLFETVFQSVETQIDKLPRLFDAEAATGDFLRWLSTWLGMARESGLDETIVRTLVLRAPDLYRKRGTRQGIEEIIEIVSGARPLIVEHFQLGCTINEEIRGLYHGLYGTDPYCFCVLLEPEQPRCDGRPGALMQKRLHARSGDSRRMIRRILDQEKPAHTCAGLVDLQPWVLLDMHTYLGVNTYLSKPSPMLDTGAWMPTDTVLSDYPEAGQTGRRSRLGLDTSLT